MATVKTRDDEELVTVKLPRIPGGEETKFVGVNERVWLIKRGYEVQIPYCAYKRLLLSEDAEYIAVKFSESKRNAEG